MTLASSLARAVATARDLLHDPLGRVHVVLPSVVASELARRELGAAHDVFDVRFTTPGRLVSELAAVELALADLVPAPPGWHRARIEALLDAGSLGGRFAPTLQARGWAGALASLARELEAEGVGAAQLRDLDLPEDLAERCTLAAELLDALQSLATEEGVADARRTREAALAAIDGGHPLTEPGAVVLLGDARLPRLQREVLSRWLVGRPVVRLALPSFEELALDPHGLLALAPDAAVVPCEEGSSDIQLVSTPDEIREATELVRAVQGALAADPDLALDRIALVLPDAEIVEPLAAALQRAGLPVTWQIGRPLAETPAGRFVAALLALHDEAPVAQWYALLVEPGLRLRGRLGAQVVDGRGRWRRLLAPVRQARSIRAVLASLDARIEEQEPEGDDLPALRGVRAALVAVREIVAGLRRARTPGELAALLIPLLDPRTGWWRRAPDAARLSSALEIVAADRGRPTTYRRSADLLLDLLAETPLLQGALSDRALRVLEPMGTLGGSFDLVLLAGLVNKRFPREPRQDPILPDAVRTAIEAAHGIALLRSDGVLQAERRRLAAVRSASRGRLVGFVPRTDFAKGRPNLLSPFARDLASLAAGRELSFAEAEDALQPRGSRSGVPPTPAEALGSMEHLAARLQDGDGLGAALAHPAVGGSMRRARALARAAAGDRSPEVLPHIGVVPAELAAPEGGWSEPASPRSLWSLLDDPESWLLRELGAFPLKSLNPRFDPTAAWAVRRRLLRLLSEALAEGRVDRDTLLERATDHLRAELRDLGFDDAEGLVVDARRAAETELAETSDLRPGPGLTEATPVEDGAPFVVEGGDGLPGEAGPVALLEREPKKNDRPVAGRGVVLEALARGTGLTLRALDGSSVDVSHAELAEVAAGLHATARSVQAGWFPSRDAGESSFYRTAPPRHRLADEAPWDWHDPDVSSGVLGRIGGER